MRRVALLFACASAAFALSVPASSAATVPCWKTVIADWSKDNSVDGRYSAACLRQAMQNAPTDLKIYSSFEDDVQAALRARTARHVAGVHVTPATLAASGSPSSGAFLIALLAGLAGLVLACGAVAAFVRRRRHLL